MTRQYRRRSPTVQALEVTLTNLGRIRQLPGCSIVASPMGDGTRVYVQTTGGDQVAEAGDFITTDPQGNL